MNKRMFEILDEMNVHDIENDTSFVGVSNTMVGIRKEKRGAVVEMGIPEEIMGKILIEEVIPVIILVDKVEFLKRKEVSHG